MSQVHFSDFVLFTVLVLLIDNNSTPIAYFFELVNHNIEGHLVDVINGFAQHKIQLNIPPEHSICSSWTPIDCHDHTMFLVVLITMGLLT